MKDEKNIDRILFAMKLQREADELRHRGGRFPIAKTDSSGATSSGGPQEGNLSTEEALGLRSIRNAETSRMNKFKLDDSPGGGNIIGEIVKAVHSIVPPINAKHGKTGTNYRPGTPAEEE